MSSSQNQRQQFSRNQKRIPQWSSERSLSIQKKFLRSLLDATEADYEKSMVMLTKDDFDVSLRSFIEYLEDRRMNNKRIDVTSICEDDPKGIVAEAFGGYSTLIVQDMYCSWDLQEKALLIKEYSIRRDLIDSLRIRLSELEEGEDVFDTMLSVEKDVGNLYPVDIRGGLIDVGTIVNNEIERALATYDEKKEGFIKTGFFAIDEMISGFMPGEFVFIGARPGMGKTGFGVSFSLNLVRQQIPHAFFSIEMTKEQLVRRYISQLTGIPVTRLAYEQLTEHDQETIGKKYNSLLKVNSLMSLDDTSGATVEYVRQRTKQLIAERGIKVIFVDYLQKMSLSGKFDNREREVAHISGGLAKLAKDCNIVVIAFGQLNRGVEHRTDKRPSLADIRDSGSIEQDAHRVGFLFRPEKYDIETTDDGLSTAGLAEIDWQKTRDGMTGICRLRFDDQLTRFGDYARPFE